MTTDNERPIIILKKSFPINGKTVLNLYLPVIVANCASLPHDEREMVRRKHDDKYFKYDWQV